MLALGSRFVLDEIPVTMRLVAGVSRSPMVKATVEEGSPQIFRRDGRFADMVMAELAGRFEAPLYGMLAVADRVEAHDWGNDPRFSQDQLLEMTRLAADATHAADPKAVRVINNCSLFGEYVAEGRTYKGQQPRPLRVGGPVRGQPAGFRRTGPADPPRPRHRDHR